VERPRLLATRREILEKQLLVSQERLASASMLKTRLHDAVHELNLAQAKQVLLHLTEQAGRAPPQPAALNPVLASLRASLDIASQQNARLEARNAKLAEQLDNVQQQQAETLCSVLEKCELAKHADFGSPRQDAQAPSSHASSNPTLARLHAAEALEQIASCSDDGAAGTTVQHATDEAAAKQSQLLAAARVDEASHAAQDGSIRSHALGEEPVQSLRACSAASCSNLGSREEGPCLLLEVPGEAALVDAAAASGLNTHPCSSLAPFQSADMSPLGSEDRT
jgi:hypothetical protein